MKKSDLIFTFIALLFCNTCFSQSNKINLGKFEYTINYERKNEKVGDGTLINNTFAIIRHVNSKKDLLSYFFIAKRNDSLFANGTYRFNEKTKTLITKNYFFYPSYYKIDSSYTYFLQLKNGSFKLKQQSQYINGKENKMMF